MICGVPDDDGVSDYLKVRITFTDDLKEGQKQDENSKGEDVTIVAYLTEGSSVSLSNAYTEPFAGDQIGELFNKSVGLAQTETDLTFNTVLNSVSVWEGTNPIDISLTLYFHAYTNAKKEVTEPIQQLLRLASAELNEKIPFYSDGEFNMGRVPKTPMFDIGRKIKIPMAIVDVQYELNAPKTKSGDFAYNTVTITCNPKKMLQRSAITSVFT